MEQSKKENVSGAKEKKKTMKSKKKGPKPEDTGDSQLAINRKGLLLSRLNAV